MSRTKRAKRDGTGPKEGSAQREKYGEMGKRKRSGKKCPKEK